MSGRPETFAESQAANAKRYLETALRKHKGNIAHAAREAGLRRVTFVTYVRKYGVKVNGLPPGRPKAGT